MTAVLPEQVVRLRPADPALRRLFAQVRRLPWDGARAWLSFGATGGPDFLLVDPERRAFLISAGDLRENEAEELLQPGLFAAGHSPTGTAGPGAKLRRLRDTVRELQRFASGLGFGCGDVARVLVLPALRGPAARALAPLLGDLGGIVLAGGDSFEDGLLSVRPRPLGGDELALLRGEFSPECRVPPEFVPRLRPVVSDGAGRASLSSYLLDFDQEAWVKNDLVLRGAGAAASRRARLVTGTAGSGKSLALLYRTRILAGLGGGQNILVTTHNKPLVAELRWRFEALGAAVGESVGTRIDFTHFHRWVGRFDPAGRDVIPEGERIARITALATDLFPSRKVPSSFFADEVAFLADQVDDSEAAYLALDRSGRGVPLDSRARIRFYRLYQSYRQSLAADRKTDWYFKVRIAWERVLSGRVALPRYDLIACDEAQFFAPLWFEMLRRCLDPEGGEFMIAADPTQGFLRRRGTWKSVGLDVRGRSARFGSSYRCAPAIQAFARRFYLGRDPDSRSGGEADPDAADITLPDPGESTVAVGPVLKRVRGPQDCVSQIAREVADAVLGGLRPSAVLVIHPDARQLETIAGEIAGRLGADKVCRLSHESPARGAVGLSTLNSVTGIERPVVLIAGLESVFGPEGDPRLDPRELVELRRDNTRKVYMALTRAGEKLVIYHMEELTARVLLGEEGD